MGFYEDFLKLLTESHGPGRRFKNPAQVAKHVGTTPRQIHLYLKGERKQYLQALGKIIDSLGGRLIGSLAVTELNVPDAALHEDDPVLRRLAEVTILLRRSGLEDAAIWETLFKVADAEVKNSKRPNRPK